MPSLIQIYWYCMESRWRNLIIVFVTVLLVFLVYWFVPAERPRSLGADGAIDSYGRTEAEINAILIATPGFEPKSASFKTIDTVALEKAKQQIQIVKARVQDSGFSDKSAALALADAWIARIELAISWKQLRDLKKQANFVGTESDAEVCAKKNVLLKLQQRLENARNALLREEELHNSFATGFSVLATQSGFAQQIDTASIRLELEIHLETVNEILGVCG